MSGPRAMIIISLPKRSWTTEPQVWTSQTPNRHHNHRNHLWPETVTEAANLCANPDGEPGPWCYTTDGPRWALCFPDCSS